DLAVLTHGFRFARTGAALQPPGTGIGIVVHVFDADTHGVKAAHRRHRWAVAGFRGADQPLFGIVIVSRRMLDVVERARQRVGQAEHALGIAGVGSLAVGPDRFALD